MDGHLEQGHGPFTAYVDLSFNPATSSPEKHSPKPVPSTHDASSLDEVLQTRDRKNIKAFMRDGQWTAADSIRRTLWWRVNCSVHKDAGSASIYEEMVTEVFGKGMTEHDVTMPSFVDMGTKEHYHISEPGIHIAKKVICILGNTCPDITYAPLVFPITSLLLHYMDEGDCYNCMYGLLRSRVKYIAQTKKSFEVMKYVLKDLARKYCKGWSSYIAKRGLQAEGVLDKWIWWLFRDLPFSHLVRVIDCFLVEGPKVLYRVALAILTLFHKLVVKSKPGKVDGDLERALSQFCDDIPVTPDKLLKTAFGIRGLSRKEINKFTLKSEMYVESLRHAPLPQTIPKSDSCESLNLKVSRSFSGPVNLQSADSNILGVTQWQTIWNWLPTRVTLNQPVLLYTSAEHGTSLTTFYSRIESTEPTLLVIKTSKNEIIGAYCPDDWTNRIGKQKTFFGTGETFVFTLSPKRKRYPWVGLALKEETPNAACMFQRADSQSVSIGGGGAGTSLTLDDGLSHGRSQRSMTFNNEPLVEGGDFTCLAIEVFGFGEQEV